MGGESSTLNTNYVQCLSILTPDDQRAYQQLVERFDPNIWFKPNPDGGNSSMSSMLGEEEYQLRGVFKEMLRNSYQMLTTVAPNAKLLDEQGLGFDAYVTTNQVSAGLVRLGKDGRENTLYQLIMFPPNGSYVQMGEQIIPIRRDTEVLMIPGPFLVPDCKVMMDSRDPQMIIQFNADVYARKQRPSSSSNLMNSVWSYLTD